MICPQNVTITPTTLFAKEKHNGSQSTRLPGSWHRRGGNGHRRGLGIGKLAAAAMEASGRQPEVAGQVRTSMIIAAALIEGATFFALAICIILAFK